MEDDRVQTLRSRIENARNVDEELLHLAAEELRRACPGAPSHVGPVADTTEAVLDLVDNCLPGWTITLRGTATEPDGHWHCTLRRSEARDDDAVIGIGTAPTVSLALLRALVSAAEIQGLGAA